MKIYTSSYNKVKRISSDKFFYISITVGRVPNWFPHDITRFESLAPAWDNVSLFKGNDITWDEFVKRYLEKTNILNRKEEVIKELELMSKKNSDKSPVLLCHCGDYNKCHRSIIGEIIGAKELSDNDLYQVEFML